MIKNKKIVKLSWKYIDEAVDNVSYRIEVSGRKYKNIYAIPRGGLIIGVMLSHKLGIKLIKDTRSISKDTLIVDDISDTGITLHKFKDNDIATILSTKWTKVRPRYKFNWKKRQKDWILFPWENINEEKLKCSIKK